MELKKVTNMLLLYSIKNINNELAIILHLT